MFHDSKYKDPYVVQFDSSIVPGVRDPDVTCFGSLLGPEFKDPDIQCSMIQN